jgi:hypothetical protein
MGGGRLRLVPNGLIFSVALLPRSVLHGTAATASVFSVVGLDTRKFLLKRELLDHYKFSQIQKTSNQF